MTSDHDLDQFTEQAEAMSRPQRQARLDEIARHIAELSSYKRRTRSQEDTLESLFAEQSAIGIVTEGERVKRESALRTIRENMTGGAGGADGGLVMERGAYGEAYGRDEFAPVASQHRDRAMRVVDAHVRSGQLPEHAGGLVERLVSTGPQQVRSFASQWVEATGSDAYLNAFSKWFLDSERGHLLWTEQERASWQRVQELKSMERAMSLTDASGGYGTLPYQLDPTIILDNSGTINPIRSVARRVTTVTDKWRGVTSVGSTASWDAEAAEVSDDSPTLAQPEISIHRLQAFIPFSRELEQDWAGPALAQELSKVLMDAADRLMSTAFTTGSGTGQPKGLITAVAADSGSVVSPTTAEVFASADVYSTIEALPARWRPNARWMANLNVINDIDQFETTNGAKLFPSVGDANPVLLRRPLHENSEMDGSWNTAATANNYILLVGDMQQYVIVEKAFSASIEIIPHLFGSNSRPTGQRGAYLYFRTGADCTVTDAFRLLNLATTL